MICHAQNICFVPKRLCHALSKNILITTSISSKKWAVNIVLKILKYVSTSSLSKHYQIPDFTYTAPISIGSDLYYLYLFFNLKFNPLIHAEVNRILNNNHDHSRNNLHFHIFHFIKTKIFLKVITCTYTFTTF